MWLRRRTRGHTVEEQVAFLIVVVRWLTYTLCAVVVAGLFLGYWLHAHDRDIQHKLHDMACHALQLVPPGSDTAHYLRDTYHCPR